MAKNNNHIEMFRSYEKDQNGDCSFCNSKKYVLHDVNCELFACKKCSIFLMASHVFLDECEKFGISHHIKEKL